MNTTRRADEETPKRKDRTENEVVRRRKRGGGEVHGRRLGVNSNLLDFNQFKYRWINDVPARMHSKTQDDDWDVVTNDGVKDDSADLGNAVTQIVGTKADGSPLVAYLCRKPKTFWEEDQAEKSAELDRQLAQMRSGNDRDGGPQSDYTPNTGISIA
ncbi:hypothetical protein AB3Y40_06770 [Yoonia sp. R2331]|uniref:hypothetical protein n=1 Tax=Yoonia sp. R2331 TaxID=3237238 RepID=UPI0034E5FF4A